MDIDLQDRRWLASLRTARALCRRAASSALSASPRRPAGDVALAIALADDAAVRTLNRAFRHQDKPTNVLSFAADRRASLAGAPRFLGDIALARQTVLREARAQHKRPGHHLTHLVVHGVLHLLGYDHQTDAQARRMEALEVHILTGLGIANPYA
ncbi:MAG: rRNA maturation RNase YbeY [Alphaproteobacteria bacterium]|nr:rRNA maturation RNase YbeY [Alphaproteobacteria bacterium]